MELIYSGRSQNGRFSITCKPEAQDGVPPLSELHFDWDIPLVHDDAMAVASVLAFGTYASGPLKLPKKVSPEVASAIESFLAPTWVSVSPVEFEPRANAITTGVLYVSSQIERWHRVPSETGMPRNESLVVLPASEFTGFLVSTDGLILASNGPVLSELVAPRQFVYPYLSLATLFAESFHADTVILDDDLSERIDDAEFARARDLMQSCRISLRRSETHK